MPRGINSTAPKTIFATAVSIPDNAMIAERWSAT
jgi:hypothetical protein